MRWTSYSWNGDNLWRYLIIKSNVIFSVIQEIKRASDLIESMARTTTNVFQDMKQIRFEIKQALHGARLQIKQLQVYKQDK